MAELRRAVPLVADATCGQQGQFYRLPFHNRSICCALSSVDESLYESEVLVFKGTEPLLADFASYLLEHLV